MSAVGGEHSEDGTRISGLISPYFRSVNTDVNAPAALDPAILLKDMEYRRDPLARVVAAGLRRASTA